jgi:hypothetical protein
MLSDPDLGCPTGVAVTEGIVTIADPVSCLYDKLPHLNFDLLHTPG